MHDQFTEPESNSLELKRELPSNEKLLQSVVGFCNLYGGRLLIGITDERKVIGIDERVIEATLEFIQKLIYENCTPPILPEVYTRRIGQKLVLVVEVSEGMRKPYFITAKGVNDGTFIRIGRSTMRASAELIDELRWQSKGRAPDQTPVYHASTEDIDPSLVKTFLTKRKGGFKGSVTESLLSSYSLVIKEQNRLFPTVGGILLFGREPERYLPEAFLIATRFAGTSGREAIRSQDFKGTLFTQFHESYDFAINALSSSYKIERVRRSEELEIPAIALREALLNAIIHRSYSIPGPTKIAMYDDRIEIFSPGIFPGPLSTESLDSGITYIRNIVVSRAFREAGYVEKLGTGFRTIFSSYRERGLENPSVIEGSPFITVILPRKKKSGAAAAPEQQLLDTIFRERRPVSIREAQTILGVSRATAGRRLKQLTSKKLISVSGKGRTTRYTLR